MATSNEMSGKKTRSLKTKILLFFGAFYVASFILIYLLFLNVVRGQVHSLLKEDLRQVLTASAEGIDADLLLDLAENGEPNDAGFSDDPRYIELLSYLDHIHRAEPDAWPYLYVPGDSPNEILFVVDLISLYEPEIAARFMEPYQSNSGYILTGLEQQTFRQVDAQFILVLRQWSHQIGNSWLKEAGLGLADWLSGLGLFPMQEFGVYEDKFGSWTSAYMPIENDAGEKVAAIGVDFKADLVEAEYRRARGLIFGVMLAASGVSMFYYMVFVRWVINPLRELSRIAGKMQEDDSTTETTFRNFRKVRRPDELDALADVLESMVEKLRQRERRYHAVVDAQDSLIVRTTPDGKFIFTNQAYDDLRGHAKVDDLSKLSGNDYHPDDRESTFRFVDETAPSITAEDPVRKHQMRLYDQEGNLKWYLWTVTGIFNDQGEMTEVQTVGQDITELKQIQQELEQANTRLREISHELLNATEQERNKIAREVHDDMLNYITELVLQLEGDIPARIVNQTYQMLADRLREIVYDLRPPMLAYGLNYGLKDYVQNLTDRVEKLTEVQLNLSENGSAYPKDVDVHLFRIVQLACENAVEHANPENITISADLKPEMICLLVEDDGVGFGWSNEGFIDESVGQNRFGLAGMFERALIVGAEVAVHSDEGEGTRVEISWRAEDYQQIKK